MLSRLSAPCRSELSLLVIRHFSIRVSSLKKQSLVAQLLRGHGSSPKLTTFTLKGSPKASLRAEASLAHKQVPPNASVELPVPKNGRQREQRFALDDARIAKLSLRCEKHSKEVQLRDGATKLSATEGSKKAHHIDGESSQLPVPSKLSMPGSQAYHKVCDTGSSVGCQTGRKRGSYGDRQLVSTQSRKAGAVKVSLPPQRVRKEVDHSNVLAESKPGSRGRKRLATQMGPSQDPGLHISDLENACQARNRRIIEQSVEQQQQGLKILVEFELDQAAWNKIFGTRYKTIDLSACRDVLSFLKELGLSAESRNRIICKWSNIMKTSVKNAMQPTVDLFDRVKLARPTLLKVVESYPRTLCLQVDKHLMAMYKLFQHVGLSANKFVEALSRMPHASTNVDCISQHKFFREQGLSDEAFVRMVRRNPRIVKVPVKSLKLKLDFLLHTANRDVWEIVGFPEYFNYSLTRRIIPRLMRRSRALKLRTLLGTSGS